MSGKEYEPQSLSPFNMVLVSECMMMVKLNGGAQSLAIRPHSHMFMPKDFRLRQWGLNLPYLLRQHRSISSHDVAQVNIISSRNRPLMPVSFRPPFKSVVKNSVQSSIKRTTSVPTVWRLSPVAQSTLNIFVYTNN